MSQIIAGCVILVFNDGINLLVQLNGEIPVTVAGIENSFVHNHLQITLP
ncbi:MAG: hypothetical protein IPH20_09295 [Bacteroidales bacterium]|nr:hypothetical protein [Bacteroidales bacterium]